MSLGLPADFAGVPAGQTAEAAPVSAAPAAAQPFGSITAPLAGTLVTWHKAEGERVETGEVLALMEAMKMETPILAPCSGRLRRLVPAGQMCQAGQTLGAVEEA